MKRTSRLFWNSLYGFFIVFILLSIFAGGPGNALMILLFSAICTGGIGILFWIVLSFIIGSATMAIIHLIQKKNLSNGSTLAWMSPDKAALINYIQTARNSGLNDSTITDNLRNKGWNELMIQDAFGSV